MERFPGNIGVVIRNTTDELKMTTIPEYFEVMFRDRFAPASGYYWNKTEKHLILPNSSEVWFIALDNERQLKKLKGPKFGALWIDQCEEVEQNVFNLACSRVRHDVPFRQKIITCNPEGGDHYLKELFYCQDIKTKREKIFFQNKQWPAYYGYWKGLDDSYLGITAKPMANAANIPDEKYYETLVKTLPHEWVLKYVFANWFGKTGLIYKLADGAIVSSLPFVSCMLEFPVTRFELNDYGISDTSPMVWLNIVYMNGLYYITDEYYHYDAAIESTAQYVQELETKFSIESLYRVGCPRAFQREGTSNNLTPAIIFKEHGISLSPFPVHIDTRRPILQRLFEQDKIKIHESCRELIKELRGLKWSNEKTAPAHAVEALERGLTKHYLSVRATSASEFEKQLSGKRNIADALAGASYMNTEF